MKRIKLITTILFVILALCIATSNAKDNSNTIGFDNQSWESALVKLVGPTLKTVKVANGQKRTVNVAVGEYYILVRYGVSPERYRYSKGDTFTVRQTSTQYSAITITLHKVIGGSYATHPSSAQEFNKAIANDHYTKPDKVVVFRVQKKLKELGYNPGPSDGIWGEKTEASLKAFQQKNKLAATGKIDPETREKLFHNTDKIPDLKIADADRDEYRWEWMVVSKGGAAPDNHSGEVLTISLEMLQGLSSEAVKSLEKSVKLVDEDGKTFYPFSVTYFKEFKGYDTNNKLVKDVQNLYRLSFPIPSACANYVVEWMGKKSVKACNPCIDCDKDPLSEIRKVTAKGRTQSYFWGNVK